MKNILFILTIIFSGLHAQCAMCKATIESGEANGDGIVMGSNINMGIVFLIIAVYAMIFMVFGKQIIQWLKEITALYKEKKS